MKHIHHTALWLAVFIVSAFLASCGKDFQDDIDKLNTKHTSIEQRVTTLETQVTSLNTQISQLSVLATAVEQNFYITQVNTTDDSYELTLNNGRKIVLQNMPNGTLTLIPSFSITQMDGLFYWTINGQLFTDSSGTPIRTSGQVPQVKYDNSLQQWFVSVDGGATFQNINTYTSVFINDQVLMQVINSFVSQNSTVLFNKQMLYQIISTYIQQNYKELFDIEIVDKLIVNYVDEHYTRLFSYELLEKIFKQYNFEYITSNIKVDELVNAIVNFIKEHNEIFENNEVLYEILSSYMQYNKTTIFTDELLLEVVNNFIADNQNYIDVELLTQIVTNYIDVHRDVVFNTETVKKLHMEYLKKYYAQVFSQKILIQVINTYITQNKTTIFNETLIREIINNYVQNNYITIFKKDIIVEIINNYIRLNSSTVFNHDVLVEVITNYFSKNYNLIIDRTVISQVVNDYITKHQETIISVEIVKQIINNYLEQYYAEIFTVDLLNQVVVSYIEQNMQLVTQYVRDNLDIIKDLTVDNDLCTITLKNNQTIQLVVFDAMARLRDRVQSIVVLPDNDGTIGYSANGSIYIDYLVAPSSMANVIKSGFYNKNMTLELRTVDSYGRIGAVKVYEVSASNYGWLQIGTSITNDVKAVALYVKDNKIGSTDFMTEFIVVGKKNCSGIPEDTTTPTPNPGTTNITIPYPNIQTTINDCGECVATLTLNGIQNPNTREWMTLYGTGLSGQNVWINLDDKPKGNLVTNLQDNTSMVQNDIVFTIDNSGSMGEEADAIARDIMSWAQMLTNKKLNVQFGVVGYGGYIDGAMNLTSASSLSTYLNSSTGTNRTMKFGGSDASKLQSYAKNYRRTSESVSGNECGAMAIRFANDYFTFRSNANRIYINFTDEPNQPNGNSGYSVDWFKSQANWPTTKGTVHTVYSDSYDISESANITERPWLISEYTGGTTMFIKANASDLQLDKLTVSEAITHSYTIRFLVPKELFDGKSHNVRITIISTDKTVRGVLTFSTVFKTN